MLYEALVGRRPHIGDGAVAVMRATGYDSAPDLASRVPELPARVVRIIERLLARNPDERPQSADEAAALLQGATALPAESVGLPLLDPARLVDAVVTAAVAGRSLDVQGPAGAGRTRLLHEVARRLARLGRPVAWTVRGRQPFASLGDLATPIAGLAELPLAEVTRAIAEHVRGQLRDGVVVLCDDAERLDRFTAAVIEECRSDGPIIRSVADSAAADLHIVPLTEEALAGLFHGPERLLHLPRDAAAVLHRRTRGLAARVRAGLATWDGGLLRMTRADVGRMSAGLPPVHERGQALDSELQPVWSQSTSWTAEFGATVLKDADDGVAALQQPHLHDMLAWAHIAWPDRTCRCSRG
jgi:hypothetical protein